jgi:GNAT superfamily N-acetyltransferase
MRALKDLSDKKLADAVELNHAQWLRLQGRLAWPEFHDDGDAWRVFVGKGGWPRNRVARARFAPEIAHRRVGEILATYLRAKVACNWIVGPFSQPPDLEKHLRAHGFRCMVRPPGMACDLSILPPAPALPEGVEVGLEETPQVLEPLTTEPRRLLQRGLVEMVRFKPRQYWHFTAKVEGRPVGATALLLGAGVGGLYGVQVLKEFRSRGIGTALVFAALHQARELGLHAAVLSASGMGQRVYARAGFREVCRIAFWKYGKMRQLRGEAPPKLRRFLQATIRQAVSAARTQATINIKVK